MKPFQARVKYAAGQPREFKGKLKVNLALVAIDERVMQAYTAKTGKDLIRINAEADTDKHRRLALHNTGDVVTLVKAGDYEGKPFFDVLEMPTPAQNGAPVEERGSTVDRVRTSAELMAACYGNILTAFEGSEAPDADVLGKMAISLFIHLTDD